MVNKKIHALISEDSNQFGPGTDLIVAMLAVALVLITVSSYLYNNEKRQAELLKQQNESLKQKQKESGNNFKVASISFSAGAFLVFPVTELKDRETTRRQVLKIVEEYRKTKNTFPFIFIVGHANERDALEADDRSETARLERNWIYAGRRAAVIAGLLQEFLTPDEKEHIVVVTTGEFDKAYPEDPQSQENALVEVVFAKDWKRPSREGVR